jgi:hypothetical protein
MQKQSPKTLYEKSCSIDLDDSGLQMNVTYVSSRPTTYTDLKRIVYSLDSLDQAELELIDRCFQFTKDHPKWPEYANWWMSEVGKFYSDRGLSRRDTTQTIVWRVAQDLGSRIMIACGRARPSDYRDEIEELIRDRFRTRREFCEATGLSEDMLSHVLAKRKHLAIDTLADALAKIGYTIHIAPMPDAK